MKFCIALCMLLVGHSAEEPDPEAARQYLRAIEAAQSPLHDFSCEYEGERAILVESTRQRLGAAADRIESYTGFLKSKRPGFYFNKVYMDRAAHAENPAPSLSLKTIVVTETEAQVYRQREGAEGHAMTIPVSAVDLRELGVFGQFYLITSLCDLLRYDRKRFVHEGTESIDGVECDRIAVVLGTPPYPIETGFVFRFWVALDRNGHVLRKEILSQGRLLKTYREIRLERHDDSGQTIWYPTECLVEQIDNGEVAGTERYRVLRPSVRVNRGLNRAEFAIDSPIGVPISDRLRSVASRFGQGRRPVPEKVPDAQTRLREALAQAEAQRSELVAASHTSRPPTNWAFWGPFAGFVVAAGFAVALAVVQRRSV